MSETITPRAVNWALGIAAARRREAEAARLEGIARGLRVRAHMTRRAAAAQAEPMTTEELEAASALAAKLGNPPKS